ncbi:universal stress protein [Streptomyces sp. NPDC005931]|uniref:universal stress protein n=1 Tax=Streptomyces sp. NPDC005931 TaxID=3364737 RepID=UPI00367F0890
MPARVTAGVDGSTESLAAAEWAAREAVRRGWELRLLHVGPWHPREDDAGTARAAARQRSARRILRRCEEHVRAGCPGVRVYGEQAEGPATAALATAAGDGGLLALGSRGLGRLSALVAGSVALGVVACATGPVVLVRSGTGGTATPAGSGNADVVVGADVTESCDDVLAFAFEAARVRRARLRVVHAWRAPGPLTLGPGELGLADGAAQRAEWLGYLSAVLRAWRDTCPEVEVLETVVTDDPADALPQAASGAGLLVVGHRITERPGVARTGPVTHAAIRQADCPVAVVPHP